MKAQDLKNSILQLAIQGKLVPQDPNDELAEVLYTKIQAEKQKLIKEGKIKKDKPLPPITDDEIPFQIPPTWKWVRLGDIAVVNGGFAFKSTQYKDTGIRVVRISDFDENGFKNSKTVRYDYSDDLEQYLIEQNNIIMAMTGGTVGKSLFVEHMEEPMVSNQRVATIKINPGVYSKYIDFVILAPTIQKLIQVSKNSTNDNISMDLINNFSVPLPSLAEQKRIVAKIEELEPLIKQYDQAGTELSTLNNTFPEQLKKSILQYAIQGKLVPQDANDEPAEVLYAKIQAEKQKLIKEGKIKPNKPLPPITNDEIPFLIPSTWKWVRLGDIILKLTDGTHSTPKYTDSGIPFISVKDLSSGYIDFSSTKFISEKEHKILSARCNPERGDLLLTKVGTTGIPVIVDTDKQFSLFVSVALVKLSKSNIDLDFLKILILSPLVQEQVAENTKGVGNKNWVIKDIANTFFPLPPLAEQHRIVAKVNELMQYCEELVSYQAHD